MKYLICIVLLMISFPAHSLAKIEKKNTLFGGLAIKRSFCYNPNQLTNTDNVYSLFTKIQPVLQIIDVYKINNSLSVAAGLCYASSTYHVDFTYSTSKLQFYQTFGIKTSTLKLPINMQINLTKRCYAMGGVALNLQTHNAYSYFSSAIGEDSVAIGYSFDAPFKDYLTISAQAGLSYKVGRKSFLMAHIDMDMGKAPTALVSHQLINYSRNMHTHVKFEGSPRFYYVCLGICYKIW